MSSIRPRGATIPLPPATLKALVTVYHARGLSARRLSSAIGTMHPHTGRIIAGKSRPSQILAARIGIALNLPDEFTTLMVSQSSTLGRKMRHPDGFKDTTLVGVTPCPVTMAHARDQMADAFNVAGEFALAKEFELTYRLWSIGLVPVMGGVEVIQGGALDPWREFGDGFETDPLIVWEGPPKAPRSLLPADVPEFISSIPRESVVRCSHHV